MAKKAYDLAVAVGKYTDKEGKEKNRYQTIGVVLQKDDGGLFALIEPWFNPAGCPHEPGKAVMVSLFAPRNEAQGGAPQSGAPQGDGFNDDIPFN